ncbi:hypothetical protein LDENG_00006310, partial [Lucifuga dentata]
GKVGSPVLTQALSSWVTSCEGSLVQAVLRIQVGCSDSRPSSRIRTNGSSFGTRSAHFSMNSWSWELDFRSNRIAVLEFTQRGQRSRWHVAEQLTWRTNRS